MSEILDPGNPGPDVIKLEGLRLLCTLGMHEWERHVNREVCLDLALHTDISAAAASDRIEDAVDYSGVLRQISEFVTGSKFKLIEALAEGIVEQVHQRQLRHADLAVHDHHLHDPGLA